MTYIYIILSVVLLIAIIILVGLYYIGKHYKGQQQIVQEKFSRKPPNVPKKKRTTGNAYRDFKKY